jgi:hypothetical protein
MNRGSPALIKPAIPGNVLRYAGEPRDFARVMKRSIAFYLPVLSAVAFAPSAQATTLYASPTGTATTGCDRSAPCDLTSAASTALLGLKRRRRAR